MTRYPVSLAAKEFRALFPTWAACVLVLLASVALGFDGSQPVGLLNWASRSILLWSQVAELMREALRLAAAAPVGLYVCSLGSIALGTQLFGQEFGSRTLGLLLSHPVRRRSILLIKMGVLGTMVLALAVAANVLLPVPATHPNGLVQFRVALLFTLTGLFVAPCLTLLTRSGTAGFVFSIGVPGAIAVGCELVATATWGGTVPAQLDATRAAGLSGGMLITSLAGAIGTGWIFTRIEAVEGRERVIHLAPALGTAAARPAAAGAFAPAHPLAQLTRKELYIQQMSFVVATLFVLACGGLGLLQYLSSRLRPELVESVTTLYLMLLGVIAGSIPSAEERSLGTLQSQLLLPVSARTQWMVKASVALGVVIALGAALPSLVLWLSGSAKWWGRVWPLATSALVLFTSLSLFVSSLCSNGVRALFAAILAAIGAMLAFNLVDLTFFRIMDAWARPRGMLYFPSLWGVWTYLPAVGVMTAVLLHFGSINHRADQRSFVQLGRQLAWITLAGILLLMTLGLATAGWMPVPAGW